LVFERYGVIGIPSLVIVWRSKAWFGRRSKDWRIVVLGITSGWDEWVWAWAGS
jgi:hypothetical protein